MYPADFKFGVDLKILCIYTRLAADYEEKLTTWLGTGLTQRLLGCKSPLFDTQLESCFF